MLENVGIENRLKLHDEFILTTVYVIHSSYYALHIIALMKDPAKFIKHTGRK